ncbi:MAG TPA: 2,3,4,5-tetrahydropyridine-2,6-dicarboxylate N-succinyltransferase, partial [Gammaproteobacteria bacterium]|nr:2,3,4,5-tetrahydropyridine-2,6-dicarboxylate N-succinyltransferase [Gammaproteobacteria bacterium]
MHDLQTIIEQAFENRANITPVMTDLNVKNAVQKTIDLLNTGKIRVAEKINGVWQTHQWIKKAVLLFFRTNDNQVMDAGCLQFYDKVPLKFNRESTAEFTNLGVRVVPSAIARYGAYIAPNTVLMPSYVN